MNHHPAPVDTSEASDASILTQAAACVRSPTHPPATTFVATTTWLPSGEPVLAVVGDLDLLTATAVEEALVTLTDRAMGPVILDLTRCTFIDFRGLHVLLAAQKRLERASRPLVLACDDPNLLRIFKVTRVDVLFAIYPSLAAATESEHHG